MGVLQREKDTAAAARFERRWLFHGTDQDTVPKITQQGFNRSFCGKNATAYGKGVYFARDSEYSSCTCLLAALWSASTAKASRTRSRRRFARATFCTIRQWTMCRTRACTLHIMMLRLTRST